jgi:PKD repeat protein
MRSIPLMAATTVILAAAWACGGDGGGDTGASDDPVASFTAPACTAGTACTFTDASSDPQGASTITTRIWNFGDNTGDVTATGTTQDHTFAAEGTYSVKLTVTDNTGRSNDVTQQVTVATGTPTNTPPIAAFTVPACTVNVDCSFSDLSSDAAPGTVTAWSWNFGDGSAAVADQNATHRYAAEGQYDVTLTVTDDQGATNAITQKVTVSAVAAQNCPVSANTVTCTLDIQTRGTVTVSLTARDCQLLNDNVRVTQPSGQFVFNNACRGPAPTPAVIHDVNGAPAVFEAGTQLNLIFISGQTTSPTDPAVGPPAARFSGSSSAGWVINIDDGGNTGRPGEPDFNDLVLGVTVTPAP